MLWIFLLKMDGTKKARMVCNGHPRQKGTVTLGHTYANSLDAASERLFWAIVAQENLIAIGADVSNAFAEAPPPKAPLYLYIDEAFREWWTDHLGRPPIPPECNVVRVNNAIQGHPESPRLWEKQIDQILKDIGLIPAVHEPCLYSGNIEGHRILFLRQVDDFAVATALANMAQHLIDLINQKLRINLKNMGIIDRFNGIDVHQTRYYIKLTCEKYLQKMLTNHNWCDATTIATKPTPLPPDTSYIQSLEQAIPPSTYPEQQDLQTQMGFSYRQVIGEILYPMVKCRPDIAFHATKLSQYSANPAKVHYEALRDVCRYLAHTINDGIYYWRKQPKSVSGIIMMYAGGAVGYKTKYQSTIAHSSTEAEFTAACEAGKLILFFRSILYDLHLPQQQATILYEDNQGALLMANAQQPTRRTRHMDIKTFAILEWVEQDLMILKSISTSDNAADTMTKSLARQLFYRHTDTIMGRRIPQTLRRSNVLSNSTTPSSSLSCSTDRLLHKRPPKHGGGNVHS